jgi:Bacteriophage baseplate protein W
MINANSTMLDLPFRIDGTGKVMATPDLTRQMAIRVRSIVGTSPGERVMRPNYGSGAANFVFDVDDELRASMLAVAVQDAINIWEPAVEVENIQIEPADYGDSRIELHITYRLVTTGEVQIAVIAVGATATYGWPVEQIQRIVPVAIPIAIPSEELGFGEGEFGEGGFGE